MSTLYQVLLQALYRWGGQLPLACAGLPSCSLKVPPRGNPSGPGKLGLY